MKVSKETMKKVERLKKLDEELMRIRSELLAEFGSAFASDGCFIEGFDIVNEPCGDDQGEGEYCSQGCYGESSDSGYGTYYYPIEHSRKYLAIDYTF